VVKWHTKPFPLYDEMLALIEGRHATGRGVFCVTAMTHGDAKSDEEDNKNEHDSHGIRCNDSFETSGNHSASAG
jgi:hypothetical protein